MQAGRGRVEADIAGHDLLRRERIEPFRVGRLVDIAPLVEQAQQVGFVMGHGARALSTRRAQTQHRSPPAFAGQAPSLSKGRASFYTSCMSFWAYSQNCRG